MPFPKIPDIQGETVAELIESMQKQRKEMQWLLQSLDTMNVKELHASVVNAGVLNAERVAIGSSSTYEPGYNPDGLRTEMNSRFEVTDQDFTSQISAVTTQATGAKNSADAANALLADLANDNKLTGVEKQETKKQWDIIVAEKPTISAEATTYGITTELTNFNGSYTTLATYLTPLLADLASTSDIVATTFRTNFKDYFDKKALLLKAVAEKARTLANTAQGAADAAQGTATSAQGAADAANVLLADIANDNKITATEKQDTKKEWDIIVSEKVTIDAQATTYAITTEKTTYGNAYTALSGYITPILSSLTTTTDIVGTTFRTTFKTYYDARTALLKKISDLAKGLADTANATANTLRDTTVPALAGRVSTAESTISQHAGEIALRVTQTEFTDLSISGRNLLPNSQKVILSPNNTGTGASVLMTNESVPYTRVTATNPLSVYKWFQAELPPDFAFPGTITISLDVRTSTASTGALYMRDNIVTNEKSATTSFTLVANQWQRVTNTMTFTRDGVSNNRLFNLTSSVLVLDVRNVKIEKGNKATADWSPAPEDISATVAGVEQRVSSAESTITQHATDIGLRVTQTQVNTTVANDKQIKDTRNTNENPQYYWTTYPRQSVEEFKTRTTIGVTVGTSIYGNLTTEVPWTDASGGSIIQRFVSVDGTFERRSTSATTWSAWVQLESTAGSQAKVDLLNTNVVAPLTTRVSTAETKITSAAIVSTVTTSTTYTNDLGAKVSTATVISSINQTAEAIKISAGKIDINGAVTFSSFDASMKGVLSNADSSIINANPYFLDWTSTVPAGYSAATGTGMSKVASGNGMGNSVQFVVAAGGNHYLNPTQVTTVPYYQYITTEITFMVSSGTIDGAGVLLRYEATADIDNKIHIKDIIASPIANKWYTVTKIIKVSSATPTAGFTGYSAYLMGGWTSFGTVTAKTIQFDCLKCRPSSEQEINAYVTGATVSAKEATWDTSSADTARWKFPGKTTINGGLLETTTVSTNQLIASNPNLISDVDSFEQYNGRTPNGSTSLFSTIAVTDEDAYHGTYSLKTVSSGASSYKYLHPSADTSIGWIKLQAGKQYIISAFVKTTSTVATTLNLAFVPREGKTSTSIPGSVTATKAVVNTDGWVRMYALSPVVTGTNPYAAFYVRNVSSGITTYWDAIQLEEYATGNTSPSDFATGGTTTINGSNIITNTVTATQISVTSLSALSANLGAITAGSITGVTLNLAGGKFVVDAGGNVTFSGALSGATGTFAGSVTVSNLVISAITSGASQLTFNTTGAATQGYATLSAYSEAAFPLKIQLGKKSASGFNTTISNAFEIQILAANVLLNGNTTVNGTLLIEGDVNPQIDINLLAGKALTWPTYGGIINMLDNTYIRINKQLHTTGITNSVGSLSLRGETGVDIITQFTGETSTDLSLGNDGTPRVSSMAMYNRTGGLSANMNISSAGTISRSTSATKYKLSIEPIIIDNYAERILELKPKSWYDKSASERYADYLTKEANGEHVDLKKVDIPVVKRHNGLIAEDLVEVGLSEYVSYGEVKTDGSQEVEGLEYDRLWTLLIPIVKGLKERLEALEAQ